MVSLLIKNECDNYESTFLRMPSQNSQIQDLYFEVSKQVQCVINSFDMSHNEKERFLKDVLQNVEITAKQYGNILEEQQYNSNVINLYSKQCLKNGKSVNNIETSKTFKFSMSAGVVGSIGSYNNIMRGELLVSSNNISDVKEVYTNGFLPQITFASIVTIAGAAFKIALDYVLAPLLIFAVADVTLGAIADIMSGEKESGFFKKTVRYFITFFILTWLILLEIILTQYDIISIIKPVIEHHILVFGFLVAAIISAGNNLLTSMKRIGLPVGPFNKLVQIGLEKFAPDVISYLEKYNKKDKKHDKDSDK